MTSQHGQGGRAGDSPSEKVCPVAQALLDEFLASVRDLTALHEQLMSAILAHDPEFSRFDLLIHMANEKKQDAKYAYLHHLEEHGCSRSDRGA